MLALRPSQDRGYANHGWLESYHSFSFAEYYDPAHMGYSVLRVINDDKIAPDTGFGMHGHRDMEIITCLLEGELRHVDSMGNGAVIRAGDVQRMTAGTGVRHSEINASSHQTVHLLQIWIEPDTLGLPPSYEDKTIDSAEKYQRWALIAAPANDNAAMESAGLAAPALTIHQDMRLYATVLGAGNLLPMKVEAGRCAYVHVARGEVAIQGQRLLAGDALKVNAAVLLEVQAQAASEVLWFDLPAI